MFSKRAQEGDGLSVYRRALGARFVLLDPLLQRYFGPVPPGSTGVGHGVFEHAGYRGPRWLRPLMVIFAAAEVMFPDAASNVPFTVENTPGPGTSLRGVRLFRFPNRARRMVDAMTASRGGEVVDRVGRGGLLEVRLRPEVTRGGMRLRSVALALRAGRLRLPLPPMASVVVDERVDRVDPARQRVDGRVSMWPVGEIFRYRGSFTYRIQSAVGNPSAGVVPPA
ncbi:DUF4166 domain-containing protein [Microbacterium sp. NM3R9]|uniref:DUF4166 domain-containing protein n=1 Tax=Microbacterium thalli TaxID=3027921 RepID=UPI0023673072|nr:DUF4166 domain-containing protein [Microbacterium thalli]MDN8547607.1 DUF4166 domain-containing protein [Microbacterium thalli]